MNAIVDESTCTGCGLCVETCPEVFEMNDEVAVVKAYPGSPEVEKNCRIAADECPVDAITIEE